VLDEQVRFFKTGRRYTDLNQAEDIFPAGFFTSSGPGNPNNHPSGGKKGRTMNPSIQRKTTPSLLLTLTLLFVCSGVLPKVQAVVPPPEGGYPNFTTAAGDHALQALTLGVGNTAIGTFSSFSVTTGNFNTAVGAGSLDLNTADSNTATGAAALLFNTTGTENTSNGTAALEFNDTGSNNTATGAFALFNNTGANNNTANGFQALWQNTTGGYNTAMGYRALFDNINGGFNTAIGISALISNTQGTTNTATGHEALGANTTGSNNTAIGFQAGFNITGDDNVCIGAGVAGVFDESNTTRIKNVYSSVASGRAVYVNSDNKIGTLASSRRFKDEIRPMDKNSEAILALRPVTFRYKKEIEPNGRAMMFGLIAEEVEKVAPELVTHNDEGEVETVRYEAVNAMLLNEFLKEHRTVEKLKSTVAKQEATIAQQQKNFQATASRQQKEIEALTATVKEQAAQIQKVSDQLELSRPAPQTVLNNH
jgi:hypothetical protein